MKRIEFLKNDLTGVPLPQEGYKTIGIDSDGVVKTIDDQGNIEPIGGSASGGSFGKVGISNSEGEYTYYPGLTAAFASATAGQTVKQFADITETTDITITVPLNVHWDLNGYKYEKTTGTGTVLNIIASNSTNHITNGTIKGSANCGILWMPSGTNMTVFGSGLKIINTTGAPFVVDLYDPSNSLYYAYVETQGGVCCYRGKYYYVTTLAKTTGYGLWRFNEAHHCKATSIGGVALETTTATKLVSNVTAISNGSHAVFMNGGKLHSVTAYSTVGNAFRHVTSGSELINCYGFSSGAEALYAPAGCKFLNSTFHSSVAAACFNNNVSSVGYECIFNNCTLISDASYVIFLNHYHTFNDCTFISNWDTVGGACLLVQLSAGHRATRILGGSMEVTNVGANFIDDYGAATSLSWAGVKMYSNVAVTTPVSANVTQAITNLEDNQGNIIINV